MIHLDTSFLIRGLVHGSPEDRALRKWLREGERLVMSVIAWTELLCGPLAESHISSQAKSCQRVPFVEEDAVFQRAHLQRVGRRRGSLTDCMITRPARCALENHSRRPTPPISGVHVCGLASLEA
jgi:predicted nucleic acid-binding protein